ncbi:polysaccharide biosynthesis C-terminal domain-containing protein, partial [Candidatus Woesearchaeota archaeon]|nr:polysaccharide biosynthesis C-terminal domain-containing protein [Candidatus Woesearchaeota archaeon]
RFSLSIITGVFLIASSTFLAKYYFKTPAAAGLLKLAAVAILVWYLWVMIDTIFAGFQRMYAVGLLNLSWKLVFFVAILGFVFFTSLRGATMAMCAFIVGLSSFVLFLSPTKQVFANLTLPLKLSSVLLRKLTMFALPAMLNSFGSMIVGYLDVMMLTYFRTYPEVGVYNVVLPTALILTHLGTSIAIVLFPMVSELWAKGNKKRLAQGLRLLYKYSPFIVVPGALTLFVYPDFVLRLLFGTPYASGSLALVVFGYTFASGPLALQIISIGIIMSTLYLVNSSVLGGIGVPIENTKVLIPAAVFNFILNLFLIPKFGIVGAAFSTTLSYILMVVLSIIKVKRFISFSLPWSDWLKIITCGAIFLLTILFLNRWLVLNLYLKVALSVIASGVVYLLSAILLGLVKLEDLTQFPLLKSLLKR